jgi:PadR family transcriptional regulator PadR
MEIDRRERARGNEAPRCSWPGRMPSGRKGVLDSPYVDLRHMRVTGPLLKLLNAFLEAPSAEFYGLELARTTGLKSGTLYPLLDRLEREGWVRSRWEKTEPSDQGRPRRRFYALTGTGRHEAQQVLIEHGVGRLLWT